jgi:hypothetical protein
MAAQRSDSSRDESVRVFKKNVMLDCGASCDAQDSALQISAFFPQNPPLFSRLWMHAPRVCATVIGSRWSPGPRSIELKPCKNRRKSVKTAKNQ